MFNTLEYQEMILHLARDDKFVDEGYAQFEIASPGNNELKIITQTDKFVYIKTKNASTITPNKLLSKVFLNSLKKYEFVVLHWLDEIKIRMINKAPEGVKIIWIGWGGDYYDLINKKILLPKTEQLSIQLKRERPFKSKVKVFVLDAIKKFSKETRSKKNALLKIDYISPVLKEDYDLIKESNPSFHPKYIDWNYGSLDQLLGNKILDISNNNILLGNSATLENNHLEAFDILSRLDLGDRKIICPLSYWYGEYRDKVAERGSFVFGNRFIPLVDYMEANAYRDILSSCSVVVMNHIRQQALGNINIMLYFGAKIFLNKKNPIYQFFVDNGAVIYSIDELSNEHINTYLSKSEIEINRKILERHWGKEVMKEKTKKLIAVFSNKR